MSGREGGEILREQRLLQVLLGAHVSEKTNTIADENNQFTFRVAGDATREEVKGAVEFLYKVSVEKVSILNIKGKAKRTQRGWSKKPGWKKAYVRIAPGQDIDFAQAAD